MYIHFMEGSSRSALTRCSYVAAAFGRDPASWHGFASCSQPVGDQSWAIGWRCVAVAPALHLSLHASCPLHVVPPALTCRWTVSGGKSPPKSAPEKARKKRAAAMSPLAEMIDRQRNLLSSSSSRSLALIPLLPHPHPRRSTTTLSPCRCSDEVPSRARPCSRMP